MNLENNRVDWRSDFSGLHRDFSDWKCFISNLKRSISNWKRFIFDWKYSFSDWKCFISDWKYSISNWKRSISDWKCFVSNRKCSVSNWKNVFLSVKSGGKGQFYVKTRLFDEFLPKSGSFKRVNSPQCRSRREEALTKNRLTGVEMRFVKGAESRSDGR